MLDKKDLDAIEKMFDKKFLEVEDRLDKKIDQKMDSKFEVFEEKILNIIDGKFETFEEKMLNIMDSKLNTRFTKFTEELSEVLIDFTYTIGKRFSEMEAKFDKKVEEQNKRLDRQNKKLDFVVDCYKDNLEKHAKYDDNLSKINSKLFDHDLRLDSLESNIVTTAI